MADSDLQITVGVDETALEAGLTKAQAEVAAFTAELRKSAAEMVAAGASADSALGQKVLAASAGLSAAKARVAELSGQLHAAAPAAAEGGKALGEFGHAAEAVLGALNTLSAAGAVEAFESLGKAGESAAASFGPLGGLLSGTIGKLVAFGAAAGATALAGYELSKSAAEDVVELDNLATAAGGSIQDILALKAVFADANASTENLARSLKRLAIETATTWPDIAAAVRDSAASIERDQLKIADGARGLASSQEGLISAYLKVKEAAIAAAEAQDNVQSAQNKTKEATLSVAEAEDKAQHAYQGIQGAQLALEKAQYEQQRAYGAPRNRQLEEEFTRRSADLAEKEAEAAKREAVRQAERAPLAAQEARIEQRRAAEGEQRAPLEQEQAQLGIVSALREQAAAYDASRIAILNFQAALNAFTDDLNKNVAVVAKQIFEGGGTGVDLRNVTPDTIKKAIVAEAGPGATPLAIYDELHRASEVITDNSKLLAVIGLFIGGRQVTQQDVAAVRTNTPEARARLAAEIKPTAEAITGEVAPARAELTAIQQFQETIRLLVDRLAGPSFAPAAAKIEGLTAGLEGKSLTDLFEAAGKDAVELGALAIAAKNAADALSSIVGKGGGGAGAATVEAVAAGAGGRAVGAAGEVAQAAAQRTTSGAVAEAAPGVAPRAAPFLARAAPFLEGAGAFVRGGATFALIDAILGLTVGENPEFAKGREASERAPPSNPYGLTPNQADVLLHSSDYGRSEPHIAPPAAAVTAVVSPSLAPPSAAPLPSPASSTVLSSLVNTLVESTVERVVRDAEGAANAPTVPEATPPTPQPATTVVSVGGKSYTVPVEQPAAPSVATPAAPPGAPPPAAPAAGPTGGPLLGGAGFAGGGSAEALASLNETLAGLRAILGAFRPTATPAAVALPEGAAATIAPAATAPASGETAASPTVAQGSGLLSALASIATPLETAAAGLAQAPSAIAEAVAGKPGPAAAPSPPSGEAPAAPVPPQAATILTQIIGALAGPAPAAGAPGAAGAGGAPGAPVSHEITLPAEALANAASKQSAAADKLSAAADRLGRGAAAPPPAQGASASPPSAGAPYASGGPIRGPGTGTSDSILARVSAGEFIVRADGGNLGDAVKHFGHRLGGPVTRAFAAGGFVEGDPAPHPLAGLADRMISSAVRAFAEGGEVSAVDATAQSQVETGFSGSAQSAPSGLDAATAPPSFAAGGKVEKNIDANEERLRADDAAAKRTREEGARSHLGVGGYARGGFVEHPGAPPHPLAGVADRLLGQIKAFAEGGEVGDEEQRRRGPFKTLSGDDSPEPHRGGAFRPLAGDERDSEPRHGAFKELGEREESEEPRPPRRGPFGTLAPESGQNHRRGAFRTLDDEERTPRRGPFGTVSPGFALGGLIRAFSGGGEVAADSKNETGRSSFVPPAAPMPPTFRLGGLVRAFSGGGEVPASFPPSAPAQGQMEFDLSGSGASAPSGPAAALPAFAAGGAVNASETQIGQTVSQIAHTIANFATSSSQTSINLTSAGAQLLAAAAAASAPSASGQADEAPAPAYATGGLVGALGRAFDAPGSPAYASGGPVHASPGVINALAQSFSLGGLADLPAYRSGGLVAFFPEMIGNLMPDLPRFADGGAVADAAPSAGSGPSGRPVVFNFSDGHSFTMTASHEVAEAFGRYSVERQLTQSGKKPTWSR